MLHQLLKLLKRSSQFLLGICSLILVLAGVARTSAAPAEDPKVREIVEGIKQAHARLLHAPDGLGIQYRLDVEQDRNNPAFVWMDGLDGLVNIRWPIVKTRIEGAMFSFAGQEKRLSSEKTVREANYNFESNRSVAKDGTALGQVTAYRHSFSANTAFPLNLQYYAEMDQFYNPGEPVNTERLLPDVLEQHEYRLMADENVDGTRCAVLQRAPLDTIWIAPSKNYVVCKRGQHVASGGLYERISTTDIREVVPGLWIPYKQIQEVFNPEQPNGRILMLVVKITKVSTPITDEDTKVVPGRDIRRIEDSMSNKTYYPQRLGEKRDYALLQAIERARDRDDTKKSRAGIYRALVIFNILAGLASLYLYVRYKRRKRSINP